jgi:hypothetical protein
VLRRVLNPLSPVESMELLLDKLGKTRSNAEFLASMSGTRRRTHSSVPRSWNRRIRIRVLSDNVANKIAAGEVVERPASVVKELIENSLDAGATDLRIDVDSGGRRLIRVADNGSGMLRDDALLAFERHATSKLSDVKDLLSIATLGFGARRCPPSLRCRGCCSKRARRRDHGAAVEIAGGRSCAAMSFAAHRNHHHVRDLVLQRSGAQEVSAVRSNRTGAHRFARDALQPGASQEIVPAALMACRNCWTSRRWRRCGSASIRCSAIQTLEDLIDLDYVERSSKLSRPTIAPRASSRCAASFPGRKCRR